MFVSAAKLTLLPFALAAAPLVAQAPALPPQVSTAASLDISNTVHCAYDQLSTEDREMALLLFEREVGSGRTSHAGSPNLLVIDRLIGEAKARCGKPYAWSRSREDAAIAYAMNELMSESVAQALVAKGHSITAVEVYFAQHRSEFAGVSEIKGAQSEAFRSYLIAQGWDKGETTILAIAEYYLESLLARDSETQHFAAAVQEPASFQAKAKVLKDSPRRARTAKRGKR
ncbi:MAG: hypothetical protein ACKOQM_10660 [Novosphingobium sp.]